MEWFYVTGVHAGLAEMRGDDELHPRPGVIAGLPRAAADLGQDVVIPLGVSPQVLLDADEDGVENAAAGEDQALQASRHAAVTVPERVDHH